jgi:hypothetical protein
MTDDRRIYRRFSIWFPVTMRVGEREVWAICRDASAGGLLVSAVAPVDIGTELELRFRVKPTPGQAADHLIVGRVVRHEENTDDLLLAFPFRLALEFDGAVNELLAELSRFAEPDPK